MVSVTFELVWLKQFLTKLQFGHVTQMTLICDNQTTLYISFNFAFHERTKHVDIDYYFIQEKNVSGDIKTEFVNLNYQLANIFTKFLRDRELIIFVTSLVHTIYMHQLEGSVGYITFNVNYGNNIYC